jgi:hypothetical protein
MDCKTARLLLEFARPTASDLDPSEHEVLEGHLGQCPECAELAGTEQLFDRRIGEAMRQVEVPDRLKAHLLARLQAERGHSFRRFVGPISRALTAAAAVLLIVWGIGRWREEQLPPVDLEDVRANLSEINQKEHPADDAEAYFRKHGWTVQVPTDLNYAFLASYDLAEFQDRQVPHLLFVHRFPNGVRECAQVYLVSGKHFNLKTLARPELPPGGYDYQIEVRYRPGAEQGWIILYTGESLNWLKKRRDETGAAT